MDEGKEQAEIAEIKENIIYQLLAHRRLGGLSIPHVRQAVDTYGLSSDAKVFGQAINELIREKMVDIMIADTQTYLWLPPAEKNPQ